LALLRRSRCQSRLWRGRLARRSRVTRNEGWDRRQNPEDFAPGSPPIGGFFMTTKPRAPGARRAAWRRSPSAPRNADDRVGSRLGVGPRNVPILSLRGESERQSIVVGFAIGARSPTPLGSNERSSPELSRRTWLDALCDKAWTPNSPTSASATASAKAILSRRRLRHDSISTHLRAWQNFCENTLTPAHRRSPHISAGWAS
jgi:hypothetical protein